MKELFLEESLRFAELKKLPELQTKQYGSFIGFAIIKMKKVGNRIVYGIGKWDKEERKVFVAQDFDTKMTEEILEVYPYQSQVEENVVESADPKKSLKLKRLFLASCGYDKNLLIGLTNLKADIMIREIEELQYKIKEITGKEVEDHTVKVLTEILEKVKKG